MVGEGVTTLNVQDKVGVSPVRYSCLKCRYCKMTHTQMCEERIYLYGEGFFGGYCTHVQIDHNWAVKVPSGLDLQQLPPLLCAGVTTYGPLKRFQKVGAKCAVLGIGGLGHLGIQFANKMGMRVTAFTTRLHTIDALRKLGAADASHSTDKESLKKEEGKYDVVLSTLYIEDPELYQLHQRLTKPGGVHIMVGVPDNSAIYQLDTEYLVNNEITLAGSNVGSIKEVAEMMQFAADYGIESVNEHFDFGDFPKALHRAEKEHPHYRCVINVVDWAKKNGFDK